MYRKKCKECGRRFEGFTQRQADYMWKQHMISKHPEKVTVAD